MTEVSVLEAKWMQDGAGDWLCLRVPTVLSAMDVVDELQPGKEYRAQIKRKGRSLDASAYAWVLLDKLAAHYGIPRNDVYREEIRIIGGVSDVVCMVSKAADEFCRRWEAKGIGWMAEQGPSKIPGCVNVEVWYGSSTYDTEQMSRLIDQIVADCREAGIETMTPQELDALKSRWGEAQPLGGDKGD